MTTVHSNLYHNQRYRLTPTDGFPTPTSHVQAETEAVLREHLPSRLASPTSPNTDPSSGSTAPANANPNTPQPKADSNKPADPDAQLKKQAHMQFLVKHLVNGFPARYLSQDASQPWLMFWTLQAFSALQVGLDRGNAQRIIDKVLTWQHPTEGGFGGGPSQAPHLLATYAAVCCLGVVGREGDNGGWDQIDRVKLYKFFMSLKQPDGSFTVARGGEVDVRGIYCLLAVATLLDLLTPELVAGTPAFLASCQTYEGGFASGSCFSGELGSLVSGTTAGSTDARARMRMTPRARPALGEAHGGYTFCALASWVLLQPFVGGEKGVLNADVGSPAFSPSSGTAPASTATSPSTTATPSVTDTKPPPTPPPPPTSTTSTTTHIDVCALLRWLVSMQGGGAELGGFRGRTNKLVDGCYAWWCGGAFALLEALGVGGMQNAPAVGAEAETEDGGGLEDGVGTGAKDGGNEGDGEGDIWDEVDDGLYNRAALQEYILYAGQHPAGGLRDKPPKNADAYHTLYCLSGLSAAQHHVYPSRARRAQVEAVWSASESDTPEENARRKSVFSALVSWTEEEGTSIIVGGPGNRVNATHPLTNLTITHTEAMAAHFYKQRPPARTRSKVGKA